ncbi:YceK/YidQ family lipoprotein [Pseudomonas uvaldensis]|uniref:YceK/YidQ family lipoprotein n=1 Tax=Pseudomonas uvaldensis TaxID=2878385 RepID=UPI002FCD7D1F
MTPCPARWWNTHSASGNDPRCRNGSSCNVLRCRRHADTADDARATSALAPFAIIDPPSGFVADTLILPR